MSHLIHGGCSQRVFRYVGVIGRYAGMIGLSLALPLLGTGASTFGQTKKVAEETVTGTLDVVEKKGKTAKITVKREDGDELEVMLTPKMRLMIEGAGDRDCLRPNTVVECDATMSNNLFFSSVFRVYVGAGQPQVGAQRDPMAPDQYRLIGQVLAVDETGMMFNLGPQGGGQQRLNFDNGQVSKVTIVSADVNFLEEGLDVELTGLMRAGKLLPSSIKVARKEAFAADDLFTNSKTAARSKSAAAKTAVAKKSKPGSEGDAPAGADPFGVMGKKDVKAKGTTKDKPLQVPDPFGAASKDTKGSAVKPVEAADPFATGKKDAKSPGEKPKAAPSEAADPFGAGKKTDKK